MAFKFISKLVDSEVASCKESPTLFRGNTLTTKVSNFHLTISYVSNYCHHLSTLPCFLCSLFDLPFQRHAHTSEISHGFHFLGHRHIHEIAWAGGSI